MFEDTVNIDTQAVEDLKDIMEDEFEHLIKLYLQDSQEKITQLSHAVNNQDIDLATKTLHSLKGASSNVGAKRLYMLCQFAEAAGRDNNMSDIVSAVPEIADVFLIVEKSLRAYL